MRRKSEPHVNHERWVLSYADFVTLMFALFVAMYAISLKDHSSGQKISESVRKAVASGGLPTAVHSLMETGRPDVKRSPAKPNPTLPGDASLVEPFHHLSHELQKEINSGAIRVQLDARGLVVTLQEKAFFPSGTDVIYEAAYPSIEKVAKIIATLPNPVRLEGHTDAVPIYNARFKNNWELSTARSIALLQIFQAKFGVNADRFAVAGYAQNAPVAPNATEKGRARNRRVEIVILDKQRSPGPASE
jgi:chemotaxis protein MotB